MTKISGVAGASDKFVEELAETCAEPGGEHDFASPPESIFANAKGDRG